MSPSFHSLHQQKACHPGSRRKLPPPAYQVWLTSLCGLPPIERAFPMHTYNQNLVSVLVALCISYTPKVCSHCSRCCCCLLPYDRQRMGICLNSARGPGLYHRSWPFSFLHLPSTPSSPWLLSISRASRESAMMTRLSAYRSSPGTPEQNSSDKASSTMMKSKGLSTDPWWSPTFTSNSWLKPTPTQTQLHTLVYIPWTNRTIQSSTPSFLRAHQITFWGTWSIILIISSFSVIIFHCSWEGHQLTRLQSVCITSIVNDNCPTWNSGREIIISMRGCGRTRFILICPHQDVQCIQFTIGDPCRNF